MSERGGRGGRGRGRGRGRAVAHVHHNNTVQEQSRAAIIERQWEHFAERIRNFHPDGSYTDEQRRFLEELCSDGLLKADAQFTFEMIVHELSMFIELESEADLVPWRALPTEQKKDFLLTKMPNLVRALEARQATLANVPETEAPRYLFRWLEIHPDSFNINLLIDIGASLGFRYKPRQTTVLICSRISSSRLRSRLRSIIFMN